MTEEADTKKAAASASPTKTVAAKPPASSEPRRAEGLADGGLVTVKGKKKKKRKYSRGLKEFQRAGRRGAKGGRRIARAVASGFALFYKRLDRSSRKKRDGMLRDLFKNTSRGLSKTIRRASRAPVDFADAFDNKTMRRTTKQVARLFAIPLWR